MSVLTLIDFKNLALDLVLALQSLPASRILPSTTGRGTLLTELSGLVPLVESSEFDAERIVPLLRVVVNKEPDEIIFAKAYAAVTEATKATPPPRPQAQFLQTPYTHSTSSIVNSSEQRQHMDDLLKEEMGASIHWHTRLPRSILREDPPSGRERRSCVQKMPGGWCSFVWRGYRLERLAKRSSGKGGAEVVC
jgi:hypothetical protein